MTYTTKSQYNNWVPGLPLMFFPRRSNPACTVLHWPTIVFFFLQIFFKFDTCQMKGYAYMAETMFCWGPLIVGEEKTLLCPHIL